MEKTTTTALLHACNAVWPGTVSAGLCGWNGPPETQHNPRLWLLAAVSCGPFWKLLTYKTKSMTSLGEAWLMRHTHVSLGIRPVLRKLSVCCSQLWGRLWGEDLLGVLLPCASVLKVIHQASKLLNNDPHDGLGSNVNFLVSMEFHIGPWWHRASCPMAHPTFLPLLSSKRASLALCRNEPAWSRTTSDPRKMPTQTLEAEIRAFQQGIPGFWVWWACLPRDGSEVTREEEQTGVFREAWVAGQTI